MHKNVCFLHFLYKLHKNMLFIDGISSNIYVKYLPYCLTKAVWQVLDRQCLSHYTYFHLSRFVHIYKFSKVINRWHKFPEARPQHNLNEPDLVSNILEYWQLVLRWCWRVELVYFWLVLHLDQFRSRFRVTETGRENFNSIKALTT